MDRIVQALGGLLLTAVPTVILLIFVHFYLKLVFFRPLEGVLGKRREVTEGAREAGQEALARASEKAAMYEIALKEARAEMYREQEETRRGWMEQQTARVEEARNRTHALIQDASHKIESDAAEARRELASSSQMLALQIAEALATGRMK